MIRSASSYALQRFFNEGSEGNLCVTGSDLERALEEMDDRGSSPEDSDSTAAFFNDDDATAVESFLATLGLQDYAPAFFQQQAETPKQLFANEVLASDLAQ